MPATDVVYFAEEDGTCPLLEWFRELPEKVRDGVRDRIWRLKEHGYELRRPLADTLRDGIHELRVRRGNVQYRILYFFCGQQAVLSHGFVKRGRSVPAKEISLAVSRRSIFEREPGAHTFML